MTYFNSEEEFMKTCFNHDSLQSVIEEMEDHWECFWENSKNNTIPGVLLLKTGNEQEEDDGNYAALSFVSYDGGRKYTEKGYSFMVSKVENGKRTEASFRVNPLAALNMFREFSGQNTQEKLDGLFLDFLGTLTVKCISGSDGKHSIFVKEFDSKRGVMELLYTFFYPQVQQYFSLHHQKARTKLFEAVKMETPGIYFEEKNGEVVMKYAFMHQCREYGLSGAEAECILEKAKQFLSGREAAAPDADKVDNTEEMNGRDLKEYVLGLSEVQCEKIRKTASILVSENELTSEMEEKPFMVPSVFVKNEQFWDEILNEYHAKRMEGSLVTNAYFFSVSTVLLRWMKQKGVHSYQWQKLECPYSENSCRLEFDEEYTWFTREGIMVLEDRIKKYRAYRDDKDEMEEAETTEAETTQGNVRGVTMTENDGTGDVSLENNREDENKEKQTGLTEKEKNKTPLFNSIYEIRKNFLKEGSIKKFMEDNRDNERLYWKNRKGSMWDYIPGGSMWDYIPGIILYDSATDNGNLHDSKNHVVLSFVSYEGGMDHTGFGYAFIVTREGEGMYPVFSYRVMLETALAVFERLCQAVTADIILGTFLSSLDFTHVQTVTGEKNNGHPYEEYKLFESAESCDQDDRVVWEILFMLFHDEMNQYMKEFHPDCEINIKTAASIQPPDLFLFNDENGPELSIVFEGEMSFTIPLSGKTSEMALQKLKSVTDTAKKACDHDADELPDMDGKETE